MRERNNSAPRTSIHQFVQLARIVSLWPVIQFLFVLGHIKERMAHFKKLVTFFQYAVCLQNESVETLEMKTLRRLPMLAYVDKSVNLEAKFKRKPKESKFRSLV